MTVNLNDFKTPIFPGINDISIAPIASKGGNGPDLIYRVNGLIDALQIILNNLASGGGGGGATPEFRIAIPSSQDILGLEIYYKNCSEHSLVDNGNAILFPSDLAKSYSLGTDFQLGGSIDISSLIQEKGIGYFFFLFVVEDNHFKNYSRTDMFTCSPPGAARAFDVFLEALIYDVYNNTRSAQKIRPLVVTEVRGSVIVALADEELVIG